MTVPNDLDAPESASAALILTEANEPNAVGDPDDPPPGISLNVISLFNGFNRILNCNAARSAAGEVSEKGAVQHGDVAVEGLLPHPAKGNVECAILRTWHGC